MGLQHDQIECLFETHPGLKNVAGAIKLLIPGELGYNHKYVPTVVDGKEVCKICHDVESMHKEYHEKRLQEMKTLGHSDDDIIQEREKIALQIRHSILRPGVEFNHEPERYVYRYPLDVDDPEAGGKNAKVVCQICENFFDQDKLLKIPSSNS